jgi:hypothetical protein
MKTLSFFFSLTLLLSAFVVPAMASPTTESVDFLPEHAAMAETLYLPLVQTEATDTLLEDCPICEIDMEQYSGPLAYEEIQGLLLALNDEYHAWAVYDQVISDFGQVQPFVNIRQAEAQHIEALLPLFQAYNVPIPENPWIGNVPSFDSVQDACAVGVEAEILNAALYDELYASTERQDIIIVYQALQRASNENHLPAFERCASGTNQGNGQGNQGNGQGNGQGQGNQGTGQGNGQGNQGTGQGNGQGTGQGGQGVRDGSCTG